MTQSKNIDPVSKNIDPVSKNIDPVSKNKDPVCWKELFFHFHGAGVDDVHAKDGGQKLEIRSGKWLDAAIWKVFTCSLIWQHLAIPHFESPASGAEPHVLADHPRSRVRITRRVLYENPICRAWLAHHNMSPRKNMCGLTTLWKLNDNYFE